MKIAAINGSPKGEASNSREVISLVASFVPPESEWTVVSQIKEERSGRAVSEELLDADALLVAFPLYVDGLPASLIRYLERYADACRAWTADGRRGGRPTQRVFAVAVCGFHEGVQNALALEMLSHFCADAGLDWRGGAGLGTGEMIRELRGVPPEAGIRKPVVAALRAVASALAAGEEGRLPENRYAQHGIPRPLFKLAGEFGWRMSARKNGLRWRDLDARPLTRA